MRKYTILLTILFLSTALPLATQTPSDNSLGDLARQLRDQRSKDAKKATKVFTNDNLPAPKFGEAVSSSPAPPGAPAGAPEASSKPATPAAAEGAESNPATPPGDKAKTKDYWQEKFKAARLAVANAKEAEQLSDDELNLLEIQQAREMDSNVKADLTAKVQAKQTEVDAKKAATEQAQKALDDLMKDFKDSGAPDDWSQTE